MTPTEPVPALRLHHHRCYCFYRGGAWEHDNYGVTFVVADQRLGPYSLPSGEEQILLRSVPGRLIGPGHNSFTESSSGQEYIVYHAWDTDMTARRMCIDKLGWDHDLPVLHGPTWTEQSLDYSKSSAKSMEHCNNVHRNNTFQ
jgi:arabinan endo-1,5-alpha-L-arabinosidase